MGMTNTYWIKLENFVVLFCDNWFHQTWSGCRDVGSHGSGAEKGEKGPQENAEMTKATVKKGELGGRAEPSFFLGLQTSED